MLSSTSATGAGRKIIRCELSVDGCQTWRLGDIRRAAPPNSFGRHWAWVFWEISIPLSAHLTHFLTPHHLLQGLCGEGALYVLPFLHAAWTPGAHLVLASCAHVLTAIIWRCSRSAAV